MKFPIIKIITFYFNKTPTTNFTPGDNTTVTDSSTQILVTKYSFTQSMNTPIYSKNE